jgi:hypothetical protein
VARQFVLLRVTNMRGVDLDLFDFDYDLNWMAFFLDPDGRVLGRYGGRTPESATQYRTLAGLRYALAEALAAHQRRPPSPARSAPGPARTVEQYPAAQRLGPRSCVHCHHVHEFRREALQSEGKWKRDDFWIYPVPENVGLTLDPDQGNRARGVLPGSAAARLGLRQGDIVTTLNDLPVASFADVQYALHRAPAQGHVAITWQRGDRALSGRLDLPADWRQTDVSWRWSLKSLQPAPGVHGEDLTPQEKKALGLAARRLAFRQGGFVTPAARHAGVQINDVIIGADHRPLEMTARQFDVWVRLNYRVGDELTLNVLRAGQRVDLRLKLTGQ